MGKYSLKAVFDKEPAIIAGAIRAVLFAAVLFGLAIDEQQLAGIALGLEFLLTLFVRQSSTSVASPTLPQGTEVTVTTPAGQPDVQVTV